MNFKVKVMTEMQIDQSQASIAMSVFGALELVSRLLMSYLGDYIKGRILYSYVAFCLGLSILNLIAAQASTFPHMLAYSVCEFFVFKFIFLLNLCKNVLDFVSMAYLSPKGWGAKLLRKNLTSYMRAFLQHISVKNLI